jgi:DNA modification methylase
VSAAHVLVADAAALPLAEASVDCIVTSPPYNVGVDYDGVSDLRPVFDYQARVFSWCRELARVLVPGGRAWVNVAAALPGAGEERVCLAALWHQALMAAGLRFRDWVVWDQPGGMDSATAWGSYLSPNAPNLRGRYELVLVFYKHAWSRGRVQRGDVAPERWPELTRNVWRLPCAPRNGHPAPFPAELARRAIQLSTWPGERVLDPFCGSGTTIRVARELSRVGVGCELSAAYAAKSFAAVAQGVLL